jgi:hypothetical protein
MKTVMTSLERAFRDMSVHYGRITAQLHEEATRIAANASDEPVTRREMGEAFEHISESIGSFQSVLYSIAQRLAEESLAVPDEDD